MPTERYYSAHLQKKNLKKEFESGVLTSEVRILKDLIVSYCKDQDWTMVKSLTKKLIETEQKLNRMVCS